nr:ABC transporter permease subunit [Nocardioides convexus]
MKTFATVETAHLFTGILAAFVGLTLDVAAFAAEIVRGGLLAVEPGQTEAAKSLGLGKGRIFRRIVLPQAMPSIIPASGNLLIGMLKATSIVSVIAVQDLLYSVQADLQPELPDHPAAAGRHDLVHHPHHAALHRPVLRGAALRPGPRRGYDARAVAGHPRQPAAAQPHPGRPRRARMSTPLVRIRGLRKSLRPPPRPGGHRPRRRPWRGRRPARPLRVRQVHAAALHQPPGEAGRRLRRGRRGGDRLPRRRPTPARVCPTGRSPGSEPGSAWSSSSSTCSPTRPRSRTSSRVRLAAGVRRPEAAARATELLERVGLAGREASYPRQPVGGPAAAGGDRPCGGQPSGPDPLRRADQRARPGDGR